MIFICAFANVYLRCILIWPPRAFHSATVERDRCKDVRSWIARTFSSALRCQDTGNNCNMGIRISFFFPFPHNILHWQHRVPVTTDYFFFLSNCTKLSHTFNVAQMHFAVLWELRRCSLTAWGRGLTGRSGSFCGTAAAKHCARCSHILNKSQNRTVRISRFWFGFSVPYVR